MRPAGEVSLALMGAARALYREDDGTRHGPTLQELARHAQVGAGAALHTVKNLTRVGKLEKVNVRRVEYRSRPVAEYGPPRQCRAVNDETIDVASVFAVWRQG